MLAFGSPTRLAYAICNIVSSCPENWWTVNRVGLSICDRARPRDIPDMMTTKTRKYLLGQDHDWFMCFTQDALNGLRWS